MRLISSRKIRDGVELARDVVAGPPGTAPLLRAGVRLSARYAELLPKSGIGSVWIEDDLGESIDITEPLTAATRAKVHQATGAALSAAGALALPLTITLFGLVGLLVVLLFRSSIYPRDH